MCSICAYQLSKDLVIIINRTAIVSSSFNFFMDPSTCRINTYHGNVPNKLKIKRLTLIKKIQLFHDRFLAVCYVLHFIESIFVVF